MPINIFTSNMPASGTSLGFTRPLVVANFGNYKENLEVNHLGINSADFGKHKFLTMPQQGSAPTTSATEGGIYCAPVNAFSATFFQRESSAAEVGLTIFPGSATSTFAAFTNLIDLSVLVDATHPNFSGIFEVRNVTGFVIGFAMIKIYKGSLGNVFTIVPLGPNVGSLGNALTYQMSGNMLQMKCSPALVGADTVKFTIIPFYFPEG
jgi:hypothetical protein